MASVPGTGDAGRTRLGAFASWPTGAKMFAILSVALLPLALIVVLAALQTSRTADVESSARLRLAATEASRALAIELLGDVAAMRSALAAIDRDPADAPTCARLRGVLAGALASGARFELVGADGVRRCGSDIGPAARAGGGKGRVVVARVYDRALALTVLGQRGDAAATVVFPQRFLTATARPSGFVEAYELALDDGDAALVLQPLDAGMRRLARQSVPIGVDTLAVTMATPAAPLTSSTLVAMLLPIVMWIVASVIGWIVVDALMIRPLRTLTARVGRYRPGTVLDPAPSTAATAQEIRQLGATFGDLTRTLAAHEADLAAGLVRQTKLTREVHHRVKNNLQVIASLINFHSRSASGADVRDAYASIQRRVDALAVVHRHHYAEIEESRGLDARAVIGELASNLRATAPTDLGRPGITLKVAPGFLSQDVAVAVAFLITELIELAITVNPAAQIGVTLRGADLADRAVLRISSVALADGDRLAALLAERYGRILDGLSRQLRTPLEREPLTGAYEITVPITGLDGA